MPENNTCTVQHRMRRMNLGIGALCMREKVG